MATSVAPGQPGKAARRRRSGAWEGCGGVVRSDPEDGDAVASAIGDDQGAHVRRDAGETGLLSGSGDGYLAAAVEVEDADGVGAGVGYVGAVAGGVHADGVGQAMNGDREGDAVGFGVDH